MTDKEKKFEKHYTSYADRGVMDYVYDVIICLINRGSLTEAEAGNMLGLLQRNDMGNSVWQ
jgi:hypothetical protein